MSTQPGHSDRPDRPDFASAIACTSRCYPATRPTGTHSAACAKNRSALVSALDEAFDTWLAQQPTDETFTSLVTSLAETIRSEQPETRNPAAHGRLEAAARFVALVEPSPVGGASR